MPKEKTTTRKTKASKAEGGKKKKGNFLHFGLRDANADSQLQIPMLPSEVYQLICSSPTNSVPNCELRIQTSLSVRPVACHLLIESARY